MALWASSRVIPNMGVRLDEMSLLLREEVGDIRIWSVDFERKDSNIVYE